MDTSQKLNYINQLLLQEHVPIELNYKILMRIADTKKLAQLCEKDTDMLKICKMYTTEICKNALQELGFTVFENDQDICHILDVVTTLQLQNKNRQLLKNDILLHAIEKDDQTIIKFLKQNKN